MKLLAALLLTPRLNDIFGPGLPFCQLLDLDLGGVWESTHKFSAKSVGGNGLFYKKCVFAL